MSKTQATWAAILGAAQRFKIPYHLDTDVGSRYGFIIPASRPAVQKVTTAVDPEVVYAALALTLYANHIGTSVAKLFLDLHDLPVARDLAMEVAAIFVSLDLAEEGHEPQS